MARPNTPIPALSEKNKKNFFRKVSAVPTDAGCLEWTAYRVKDGYGRFGVGGKMFQSHRVAYFISTGNDPGELLVCHHCDNGKCVNPEHLYMGTDKDNVDDRDSRGRTAKGDRSGSRTKPESRPRGDTHYSRVHPESVARGERQWKAKLTEAQIIAIRSDTRFQREIALEFGVDQSLISYIKNRKIWAHI